MRRCIARLYNLGKYVDVWERSELRRIPWVRIGSPPYTLLVLIHMDYEMATFCIKCGTKAINDQHIYCTECGTKLIRSTTEKDVLCPKCGKKILDRLSVYCDGCGSQLLAISPVHVQHVDTRPLVTRPITKKKRCPACGASLFGEFRIYCNSCGAYLHGQ